jgi:hypothetical protein
LFYNAICRPSLSLQFRFIRASKQLGENFYTRLNWRSRCRSVQPIERKLFGLGRVSRRKRDIHNDRFAPTAAIRRSNTPLNPRVGSTANVYPNNLNVCKYFENFPKRCRRSFFMAAHH